MIDLSPEVRADHFYQALAEANHKLQEHHLVVKTTGQWPPKVGDSLDRFDERPDISLWMRIDDEWIPIDIVYMREMPQEPEKLKSIAQLSEDIFQKALEHRKIMDDSRYLISSEGSKFISKLENHTFIFDDEGYIRIDERRIVQRKSNGVYVPIQASDIHSHTFMTVLEVAPGIINITDPFDEIRTDGRKGMFCAIQKARRIAIDHLHGDRRSPAESYEQENGGIYIPLVRTMNELNALEAS